MYAHCIRLPSEYRGACGNCKRGDRGAKCDVQDIDGNTRADHDEEKEMVLRPDTGRPKRATQKIEDGKEQKYSA